MTTPDPEDFELTDDGAVQEVGEDDWPGKPTEDELAADENLHPTPNVGDDDAVDENGD